MPTFVTWLGMKVAEIEALHPDFLALIESSEKERDEVIEALKFAKEMYEDYIESTQIEELADLEGVGA